MGLAAVVIEDAQSAVGPPQVGVFLHGLREGFPGLPLPALGQIGQAQTLLGRRVLGVLPGQFPEQGLGLYELPVPQAGLGHFGLEAVLVLFWGQGQGAAVLGQAGQPLAGHGQAVAVGLQILGVGRLQVFLFFLFPGGLLLGE
ncbi:hypothetical protein AAU61_18110 [Desulfocarbo indianensis]|nr:hypothetical protein AAU61_18110 [Desulfocarbo indianensis]